MTIGSLSRADYIGNGTTNLYDFGFLIFNKEHLRLVVRNTADSDSVDTDLVLDTDFSVPDAAVNDDDGGTITLLDLDQAWLDGSGRLATGWTLSIIRQVPLVQGTGLGNQSAYYAKTVESAFDYLMMVAQQQQLNLDRTFRLADTIDPSTFDLVLPANMANNPGAILLINPTGDGLIVGPVAGDIALAQTYAAAAAASATAANTSKNAAATSATNAAASATAAAASAVAAAAAVVTLSDTIFTSAWDGNTNTAPSKNAVYDIVSAMIARYRNVLQCSGSHIAGQVAGTYAIPAGGNPLVVNGGGSLYPLGLITISNTEFPANLLGTFLTPKFRLRCSINVNDVAPTGNFTVGLYPVTRPATSGGAGLNIYTLGTVVAGSTTAFNAPPADYTNEQSTADFTLPQSTYCIGIVTTATIAASSLVHFNAWLDHRYA